MNVQDYLKWDKNPETHNEIKQLFDSNSPELEARMKRLEFGTAGLRGRMGAGYNCMNPLVILQTTQGLAQYLIKQPNAIQRGVVVGHDHRHNSSLYARITASVFLHFGFKVYYFDSLVHTPLVPFGVGYFGCCAGVMITASHNPKDDNGYKLYWENGVQIIPPHDSCIAASILENLEPVIDTYEIQGVEDASTCIDAYFVKVKELVGTVTKGAKICYTPMHGVGYDYAKRAFQECGLDAFYAVPLQSKPDPDFPTVVFPNPEEKGALDMAIKYANEQGCDLVFANDPDADRFAMAEKVDDTWFVFNGNQIGILLAEFLLLQSEKKKWAVLTTTVSSRMLKSFAEYHSIYYDDTLTGFKWLGNRADELIKEGYHVLFAYEEAIGYMPTTIVKDKDGISAMCVAAKHAHNIYQQGKKMVDVLKECQTKYGTFVSNNGYLLCHDPAVMKAIFDKIRQVYPQRISGVNVVGVRDLTVGYDSSTADKKPKLPISSSTQMITFELENGCVMTLRTSGTEPKIKYYTEMKVLKGDGGLQGLVDQMIQELLEPKVNGLK